MLICFIQQYSFDKSDKYYRMSRNILRIEINDVTYIASKI